MVIFIPAKMSPDQSLSFLMSPKEGEVSYELSVEAKIKINLVSLPHESSQKESFVGEEQDQNESNTQHKDMNQNKRHIPLLFTSREVTSSRQKDCGAWRLRGSNSRPSACKADALPTAPNPLLDVLSRRIERQRRTWTRYSTPRDTDRFPESEEKQIICRRRR